MSHSRHRRALRAEPLENRRLLATIAAGIQLFADDTDAAGAPVVGAPIVGTLTEGQDFWVAIVVQDQRPGGGAPAGITALPLDIDWDADFIQLASPTSTFADGATTAMGPIEVEIDNLLLTDRFPISRSLLGFRPDTSAIPSPPDGLTADEVDSFFDLRQLRGGSLPGLTGGGLPLGVDAPVGSASSLAALEPNVFSLLRMTATQDTAGTLFSLRLAGSAAVTDGDVIEGLEPLAGFRTRNFVGTNVAELGLANAVRAPLTIDAITLPSLPATLSGSVFLDTDFDGDFDASEFGVPGVVIAASGSGMSQSVTTDADGGYEFELPAGDYTLTQVQPPGLVDATIAVGQVVPGGGPRGAAVGLNQIVGITLNPGDAAVDYDFGERLARVTKRLFVADVIPELEVCDAIGLACGRLVGTSASDEILVQPMTGGGLTVQIGGGPVTAIAAGQLDVLYVDGLGGADTTNRTGSGRLAPDRSTLTETIGGIDVAIRLG